MNPGRCRTILRAVIFENAEFQDGLDGVLAAVHRGAADAGEVLATTARIVDGDPDSWVREWTATAGEAWAAAGATAARASARMHYLRAASYYAAALDQIGSGSEPERHGDLWRRQRACWDRAVERLPVPGERIAIPYEGSALPGYFFRAADEPRPLVVLNHGGGVTSGTWAAGGAAAAERGYHWMTFDGPGQQAARFVQGLPPRPDWEAVLTPVADAMAARSDVDSGCMAVLGACQAGYLVPRALAFEHRFAAAVADPGVVDLAAAWTAALPPALRAALARGDRAAFDRDLHLAELFSPDIAARLCWYGAPYEPGSRYELFAAYRLGDEAAAIRTPLLVTDSDGERRWPGQAQRLFERVQAQKELVRFAADEGAAVREARVFDWLDAYLE
jgi:dienelactone hydrolase